MYDLWHVKATHASWWGNSAFSGPIVPHRILLGSMSFILHPLQRRPTFANALKNIQHTLMPALRPLMNNWTRELSQLTSRQIAKQTSNHCNQQQIRESVCQIIRKWADEGASPFPISLGPIESDLTLFNLSQLREKSKNV